MIPNFNFRYAIGGHPAYGMAPWQPQPPEDSNHLKMPSQPQQQHPPPAFIQAPPKSSPSIAQDVTPIPAQLGPSHLVESRKEDEMRITEQKPQLMLADIEEEE